MASPVQRNPKILRLLFVKLKHIGDALLLTPTLVATRSQYPEAEIWVVVRQGTEGILAGCTAIDHLITVAPNENDQRGFGSLWRDLSTLLHIRRQRFDYAFDLSDGDRGRWMVGLSQGTQRCISATKRPINLWCDQWITQRTTTPWNRGHRVEKDHLMVSEFLPLAGEIPSLNYDEAQTKIPPSMQRVNDFVVIHPGSRWRKKRWPLDHWLILGKALLEHTNTLVISSGPAEDERKLADQLTSEIGPERVINSDGQWSWAELAGCLQLARAYVGLDTAATHLAAACQCPITAMYAYTIMEQWKPWRAKCQLFHPRQWLNSWEEVLETPPSEIMRAHQPEKVLAATREIMRAPVPDQAG
ncbi:glycosyltransferase family 9 protein [Verrucomicrobia bacterium]|nr:glycosyltransferase family 9 protein [Verrucomicrobiota bacterium]MDC0218431.1 glycosyltransferase family 9 protein [Verrucomicrobiota bacterium]